MSNQSTERRSVTPYLWIIVALLGFIAGVLTQIDSKLRQISGAVSALKETP